MSSCSDDSSLVGPVSLFLGVETSNWNVAQFTQAAQFCKQHRVSTLFIKVFEVGSSAGDTQGLWYGGINAIDIIVKAIESEGVGVVCYGFIYGDTYSGLETEINTAMMLLQKYNRLCLDWEGQYLSNPNSVTWAGEFAVALAPLPGKLWLSCPANPAENNQLPALQALSSAVNVYMPMIYNDYLAGVYQKEFQQVNAQACIQPTIDLSQEFGTNTISTIVANTKNAGVLALSAWEYSFAVNQSTLLDTIVNEFSGSTQGSNSVQLNKQGMVLDIVQSYQLETNESQDLCGPWSVGALRLAGLPNKGARGSAEDVDTWTDTEVNKYMSSGQQNWGGSSVQDMYNFMTDALDPTSKQRNLHWWDISPTIANIQKAVQAGYPVLVTANEQNIQEKKTGKRPPYPWNLNANHIFAVVGLDAQGDFICADELNNNFQGYWPPVYVASVLQPSWASVVQVVGPDPNKPWLAPVPSGDPSAWPANFNAQLFAQTQLPPPPVPAGSDLATALWNSTAAMFDGVPPDFTTGIASAWKADLLAGKMHGPPVTNEFQSPAIGGTGNVTTQGFLNGIYQWASTKAYWHPFV